MLRTRRIRFTGRAPPVQGTGRRIPRQSRGMFAYQGLIIGSVELNYFTPGQQQLIHDFVDRPAVGCCCWAGARAFRRRWPADRWPV